MSNNDHSDTTNNQTPIDYSDGVGDIVAERKYPLLTITSLDAVLKSTHGIQFLTRSIDEAYARWFVRIPHKLSGTHKIVMGMDILDKMDELLRNTFLDPVLVIAIQVGSVLNVKFHKPTPMYYARSNADWEDKADSWRTQLESTRSSLSPDDVNYLTDYSINEIIDQRLTLSVKSAANTIVRQIDALLNPGSDNALMPSPTNNNLQSKAIDGIGAPAQNEPAIYRSSTEDDENVKRRGPNRDTNKKLAHLRRIRQQSIKNGRVEITWSIACDTASIDPATAEKNDSELREQWYNAKYDPIPSGNKYA